MASFVSTGNSFLQQLGKIPNLDHTVYSLSVLCSSGTILLDMQFVPPDH